MKSTKEILNLQDLPKRTTVKGPSREEHEANRARNAKAQEVRASGIPLRYLRYYSFDDYVVKNDSQKKAVEVCKEFVAGGYETGLIFTGKNGTGKTMLSCVAIQEFIDKEPEVSNGYIIRYMYTEAIKIVRRIKGTWDRSSEADEQTAINHYIKPNVLVIDEIGMQYGSPTETQFLTEIINDRYNAKKRTIISGNMTMSEMNKILGDRIVDRFHESGKALAFDWESYRKKK